MQKAFSYLRVSSKIQIEGDGFPRQRDVIGRYAQANEIEIVREFVEEGVSGTRDDREALAELLLALDTGDVRLVLVERSDRLARDLMVSETLLAKFAKAGVKVISAESNTDLTVEDGDPTKILIRQLLGIFAQYEKSVLVNKLRVARARRRAAGGRDGRKPYGRDDWEQAVILRVKALKSEGLSLSRIAAQLNLRGIKPRGSIRAGKETKWHPTAVSRILARQT